MFSWSSVNQLEVFVCGCCEIKWPYVEGRVYSKGLGISTLGIVVNYILNNCVCQQHSFWVWGPLEIFYIIRIIRQLKESGKLVELTFLSDLPSFVFYLVNVSGMSEMISKFYPPASLNTSSRIVDGVLAVFTISRILSFKLCVVVWV